MRHALSLLRSGVELCLCVGTVLLVLTANGWIARSLFESPEDRLELAASVGDHNQLRAALRDGASINSPGRCGWTPLMLAAQRGDCETAQLCLAAGADVRATGPRRFTALHWAATRGSVPMIQLLLSRRAAIDASDELGNTPLDRARFHGNGDCAAALIGAGARAGSENDAAMGATGVPHSGHRSGVAHRS